MMMIRFTIVAAIAALVAAPMPALAGPGKQVGQSRSSVNRPAGKSGGGGIGNNNRPGGRNGNVNVGNNVNVNTNGRGNGNRNGYNNGGRDVVVVGNNGRNDWDRNDNEFLEFVGKTAAITAGASIVAAVVKDKPDGCTPVMSNGMQYQNCNGIMYQQVQGGYQQMPSNQPH